VALSAGMIATHLASGSSALHALVVLTTPPPSPPSSPSPPAQPRTGAPALFAFSVSPNTASVAGRVVNGRCARPTGQNRDHKHCRRPVALKLSYTLDITATVTLTLTRQDPGREVGGRCVKPSKKNRRHQHCTRLITIAGSINHPSTPGLNTLTFDGHIAGRPIGPGNYLLTATAAASSIAGTPQTVAIHLLS